MQKNMHFLSKLIVAALILALSGPAYGIMTKSRMSQGNNVQLSFELGNGVFTGSGMFPKGSGNLIPSFEGGWGNCMAIARDLDGDGAMEDTSNGGSRGRSIYGGNYSLESYDLLKALYDAGDRMDQAANRLENNRVWSSLDPDDMADWPPEFREGRSMSGTPILHGAETILCRFGNAFRSGFAGGVPAPGPSLEYRCHFMNFGESNDMIYTHLFIRNMSEYIKWGPNEGFVEQVANTPDGQTWNFCLAYYSAYLGIGASAASMDEGWIMHPAKAIVAMADYNGLESGFTMGGNAFYIAHKMIRNPVVNGEELVFTGHHGHRWGSDFGGPSVRDFFSMSDRGLQYRACLGELHPNPDEVAQGMYDGQLNPLTGRPAWGWPGKPLPGDEVGGHSTYDNWLWGKQGRMQSTIYAEGRDFAPRDSTSCDFVMMFVYPANPPAVFKDNDIANIYDPDLQVHAVPVEQYADVAQIVYEGGFILPETPVPPPLTIIPGDRAVTITWSNVNLNTPDAYYGFIQEHPDLDPEGKYIEYDFEGFRLYRSFVGPSDSHSEEILDCSLSGGDLAFHFVDRASDDSPYNRLRNGMRVWYALVPYDRNYDPAEGVYFSLPDEESGKTWNRPREGLYTVMPRSEASNFKTGLEMSGYSFVPTGTVTPSSLETVDLSGADGVLTDTPVYLEPAASFEFGDIINPEALPAGIVIYFKCVDMGPHGDRAGKRHFAMLDASGNETFRSPAFIAVRHYGDQPATTVALSGGMSEDGIAYEVSGTFSNLNYRNQDGDDIPVQTQVDDGGYTGADIDIMYRRWGMGMLGGKVHHTNDLWQAFVRTGKYTVTWSSSGGSVSVSVSDAVRGMDIPFNRYVDEEGWGFLPAGSTPDDFKGEMNATYPGPENIETPQSKRTFLLADSYPADNTELFYLYVNGRFFRFAKEDADGNLLPIEMPGNGTVMTITTAFGIWNDDETVFTQYVDPPWIGESWKIEGQGMTTLNDEDIDLSKIQVVPNPYLASSTLDLSPLSRRIEFVNLPDKCTIRIYTLGGNLVNVLNHIGSNRFGWGNYTDYDRIRPDNSPEVFTGYDNHGGTEAWNLKNRFGQIIASGLYFFHVTDSRGETHTGRFYIIN